MSTPSPSSLKAITLTHVRYARNDHFGHFLAWVSLIPVFITFGGFASHFFFRRELYGLTFALGLLISQLINEVIKSSVQQDRPLTCLLLEACDSHGWPSSHAQFMFFFATFFSLISYRKATFFGGSRENSRFVESLTWMFAGLTMVSRVYLGYHSVAQVCAGAVLGSVLGYLWYWVVENLIKGYFPVIEESAIGRRFYLKDTSHIHNVLKFEYDNAREARRKRRMDLSHDEDGSSSCNDDSKSD